MRKKLIQDIPFDIFLRTRERFSEIWVETLHIKGSQGRLTEVVRIEAPEQDSLLGSVTKRDFVNDRPTVSIVSGINENLVKKKSKKTFLNLVYESGNLEGVCSLHFYDPLVKRVDFFGPKILTVRAWGVEKRGMYIPNFSFCQSTTETVFQAVCEEMYKTFFLLLLSGSYHREAIDLKDEKHLILNGEEKISPTEFKSEKEYHFLRKGAKSFR